MWEVPVDDEEEVTAVQLKDGFLSHTADTKDCFLG